MTHAEKTIVHPPKHRHRLAALQTLQHLFASNNVRPQSLNDRRSGRDVPAQGCGWSASDEPTKQWGQCSRCYPWPGPEQPPLCQEAAMWLSSNPPSSAGTASVACSNTLRHNNAVAKRHVQAERLMSDTCQTRVPVHNNKQRLGSLPGV